MADGTLKVGTITTSSGSGTITIGQSGETITIPTGATQTGVGGANTPYWKAYNNSSFSFSGSTTTKMRMNTVAFESNSGSFNTSAYTFTVPSGEGGKYYVNYSFYLSASTNAHAQGFIFVNDSEILFNQQTNQSSYSSYPFLTASGMVNVSAGDTIDCRCYYNSGSPVLFGNTYTDGRYSFFEGYKLIT